MKRSATKAEKAHMDAVASLGCLLCTMPAEIHHIRAGQGMGQRASNYEVLPLCPRHHRAEYREGFHRAPRTWQEAHGTERDLLAKVQRLLAARGPR